MRGQGDLLTLEPIGVAGPVRAFVVVPDYRDGPEEGL